MSKNYLNPDMNTHVFKDKEMNYDYNRPNYFNGEVDSSKIEQ